MKATVEVLLYMMVLLASAFGISSTRDAAPATPRRIEPTEVSAQAGCLPTHDGYLRARLRGASDLDIDWGDADMQCDGGLRAENRGIRVTFLGPARGDGHQVRLVFGMAASADAETARNVPTNVTVIFEDQQKLYSTAGEGKCTIDELTLQPQAQSHGAGFIRVVARGFCTVPFTTLTGSDALVLDRFDFAGGLRDDDPR